MDHIPGDATCPGLKRHSEPGEPPVLGQAAGAEMGLERGTRSRYRGYLWASKCYSADPGEPLEHRRGHLFLDLPLGDCFPSS